MGFAHVVTNTNGTETSSRAPYAAIVWPVDVNNWQTIVDNRTHSGASNPTPHYGWENPPSTSDIAKHT